MELSGTGGCGALLSGKAAVRRHVAVLHPAPPPLHELGVSLDTGQGGWLLFLFPAAGKLHHLQTKNEAYLFCHRSFCGKHRPTQNIRRRNVGEENCILCCEDLSQISVENIQSPCCSQTIYHRKCIQVGLSLHWGPSTMAQLWASWEFSGNLSICALCWRSVCRTGSRGNLAGSLVILDL